MKRIQKRKTYFDKSLMITLGIVLIILVLPITTIFLQQKQTVRQHAATGSIPQFSHVFVIVEENKDYSQIIGSSNAPYINQLANQYGSAANFFAESHPSLPNYIALTSGSMQGIVDDCNTCVVNANSIFQEMEKIGKTWKSYHEDMPSNCYTNDTTTYVMHHNPAAYYTPIKASCAVNDVPYSQFATDLTNGKVGNLTFIIPNNNNEMHDGTIQQGDTWLKQHLPAVLNSQAYKQNGLIILTWDEDSDNGGNNQITTILISPLGKQKYKSSVRYDHYSLLRTISDGLGVPPLGTAATAPPMTDFFAQPANPNPSLSSSSSAIPLPSSISPAVIASSSPAPSVAPSSIPSPQCLGASCISPTTSLSTTVTLAPQLSPNPTSGSTTDSSNLLTLFLLLLKALLGFLGGLSRF